MSADPFAITIQHKTYRISPWRIGFFSGVWVFFALLLCALSLGENDPASRSALYVVAGVVLLIGAAMSPLVWYPKLKISSDGIELRQVGWRVSTTWDNISTFVHSSGPPGLVLKQPLTGLGASSLRLGRYLPFWYDMKESGLVKEGRWIPLDPFAYLWKRGLLQEDFRRHAPWLLP